ncbi:hypothetical protein N7491_011091 [Penicillium cf. griseofulvum]|uniref:Uncharacterized protein n=1 Tax=Penicillium cf. griseofulvum TaxID=2972120 RepID=A0A9W9N137_9EURO|nr:hypothetical protein N7472_001410 [Penicillium cf. griseofulvum]KAJ5422646.1 hypothetical protein N7491_011091 [Penicillium cf. griseofulvum]KAJ5428823.1 hypothetical protein N7445_010277 [Penicillium cf. griseofulvum]
MADNVNVSTPDKNQKIAIEWMINDPKGGFHEKNLSSKGGPPQFVSISKNDVKNNDSLKKLPEQMLSNH